MRRSRQCMQYRKQLPDEFGHLAPDAGWFRMIEQASNPANPLPGVQGFRIDLLKDLARAQHERFGAVQESIACLTERGDCAERLVNLMRNAARHLCQRRNPREFQQPVEDTLRPCRIAFEFVQMPPFRGLLSLCKLPPWEDSREVCPISRAYSLAGFRNKLRPPPMGHRQQWRCPAHDRLNG